MYVYTVESKPSNYEKYSYPFYVLCCHFGDACRRRFFCREKSACKTLQINKRFAMDQQMGFEKTGFDLVRHQNPETYEMYYKCSGCDLIMPLLLTNF